MPRPTNDLGAFSQRIAWAEGLGNFGETLKELRPAMKEMVRLVADCREQAGDRVTMSLTVNMQTMAGLASLPALLAADLLSLAKSRKAKDFIAEILPLCEELIGSYHAALAEGSDDCPDMPTTSKRGSPATKLKHLATHLESLASFQEEQYQGAETQGFELTDNDRALMKDKDLLRRAARNRHHGRSLWPIARRPCARLIHHLRPTSTTKADKSGTIFYPPTKTGYGKPPGTACN